MKGYVENIKIDFEEWKNTGECIKAKELNSKLNQQYFDTSNPHYFTGDFDAEIVMVHLNPKRNKDQFMAKCNHSTFDDYLNHYKHYGKKNYGAEANGKYKSRFDHKQLRFLKAFGVLPFTDNTRENLEIVVDKKLQLELIPYGSPDFNIEKIKVDNVRPFIENVLSLLLTKERKYIFFCGKLYDQVLKDYIVESQKTTFKLKKVNGDETRDFFDLIKIKLKFNNLSCYAFIIPQFAKQGAPIAEYSKKINELINS
jgi:hypothetical protein